MASSITSTGFKGIHVYDNTSSETENTVVDASGWLYQDNTKITSSAAELNIMTNVTKTASQINLLVTGPAAGYKMYFGKSTVATMKRVTYASHAITNIYWMGANLERAYYPTTAWAASQRPTIVTCKASLSSVATTLGVAKFSGWRKSSAATVVTNASVAGSFWYVVIGT